MRSLSTLGSFTAIASLALSAACSGAASTGFADMGDGGIDTGVGQGQGTGLGGGGGGGPLGTGTGTGSTGGSDASSTVTVIYANTDSALYTLNPTNNQVSLIGSFTGLGGGSGDDTVTDCAVNAEDEVYVNTESAVYKAALPVGAGSVALTKVATIALQANQSFYALAFAPPGVLGSGETLVGGDGNGELWSIDASTGATQDLGNFGPNPSRSGDILALSGDIVFYLGAGGAPTGLATIRSCGSSGGSCTRSNDYLAAIDMSALTAAYNSKTPAASLLAGIYGGSVGSAGPGTSQGDLFGLGAWEGSVFAFGRSSGSNPPSLVSVNTTTGAGNVITSAFSFTDGWSGAGVSTRTTVTVVAPPPIK